MTAPRVQGPKGRAAPAAPPAPLRGAEAARAFFEGAPVGLYRATPDGEFVDANAALAAILGFRDPAGLLATRARELYVDAEARRRLLASASGSGDTGSLELQVRRADGTVAWVREAFRAVRDPDGAVRWYEGALEDVSDRKAAEADHERRVEFERTLARFSTHVAGGADFDAGLVRALGELSALSGSSRAYLFLIRPDGEAMDNTHEWCAPGVSPQRDALQGLPCAAVPWWMARLRAGETIHVRDVANMPPEATAEREILEAQDVRSVLVVPVHADGTLAGFLGFDDVKRADSWREDDLRLLQVASGLLGSVLERRRAEQALRVSEDRFRLLFEQSPLSIQLFDAGGTMLAANASWERLWGIRVSDLSGYNVLEDPQLEEHGIARHLRLAFAGSPVVIPPVPYRPPIGAKEGEEVWVRAVAYPVRDAQGRVREVVVIHEDMTEQRRAEAELAASRHQLAVSEKLSALGALVSGVAHEIRTPLTFTANHLSLLDVIAERARREGQEALAQRIREHAEAAMMGVDRVNALVKGLRNYARLPSGRRERADLPQVVEEAVELFRATNRAQVAVEALLEATPPVELEREKMQQVLLNLLQNAAEAMERPGTIRVRTRRDKAGGVELVVEDDGAGLSAEAAAHLFEPFYTTKPEGTGLGLSIVRRIVDEHGGAIWHERPEGGRGARFVVRLPAAA